MTFSSGSGALLVEYTSISLLSSAALQVLHGDNSFLPWSDHRTSNNNGRALAA